MSLPAGIWILNGGARFPSTGIYASLSISSTNNTVDLNSASLVTTSSELILNVSKFVSVSSTQTWYLVAGNAGAGQTITNVTFDAARIG